MFNTILHEEYAHCLEQIAVGELLDINVYASDDSTLMSGTIDMQSFVKRISPALREALSVECGDSGQWRR